MRTSKKAVLRECVLLKPGKTDSDHVSFEICCSRYCGIHCFLLYGYPSPRLYAQNFRDCVVIPIPKSCHDLSSSDNYRPISLASCLSKVLERIVLNQYSSFFISHPLQFDFKSGSSTFSAQEL